MIVTIPLNAIRVDYPRWVSPHGDLMVQQLGDFARKYQLYQSLHLPQDLVLPIHSRVNDYMFPRARTERLYVTGLMMIYFYLVDYIYDDDQETSSTTEIANIQKNLGHNLVSLLKGQQVDNASNFEQAASSLLEEFSNIDPDWYVVFTQRLRDFMDIMIEMRSFKSNTTNMSLKEYWEIRTIDTGTFWSANLIEHANNCYLTPSQRALEKIQLATNDMAHLCGIINDMFSYPKEAARDEHPFNAIHVLMMNGHPSLESACYQLIEYFHLYLERFTKTTEAIEADGDPSLNSYVQGLREFVSCAWYWHQESPRYRHPNALFEEMRVLN